MNEQQRPIDRLLDAFVYVPLSVAGAVHDDLDALTTNGMREVELARTFGRFAVQFGRQQVEQRFSSLTGGATPVSTTSPPAPGPSAPGPSPAAPAPREAPRRPTKRPKRPTATSPEVATAGPSSSPANTVRLPIADYDSLAASQVIARLGALEGAELRLVRSYETANRGRRTILGKLDQLEHGG